MEAKHQAKATSEMLIRKPPGDVFEALVDPDISSRFWFTKGSARLETGETVAWEWEQFGVHATVAVTEVKADRLISFRWPSGEDGSTDRIVEISIEPKPENTAFVRIEERGFDEDDKNLIEKVAGQTEGWALVLSALKAYLEHNIILKVISDHKPVE